MAKSPSQIANRWASGISSATQTMTDGVNAVTVNPMEKAIRQIPAYLAGVQRAVADGTLQRGLQSVSLSDWKESMLKKAIPRVASGAMAAKPKFESFMSEFLPHIESGQRMLESMPRGDMQTNIQRAVAMMEHNAKFKRRG